jgi:hypothetical protein
MRAGVGPFADSRFSDADNSAFAADVAHGFLPNLIKVMG